MCVPTPQGDDGSADLSFVESVATEIAPHLAAGTVIVNKSTVPVGSTLVVERVLGRTDVQVVSNPEFLREGSAVPDSLHPERIVVGADDQAAAAKVGDLFAGTHAPLLITDAATAETIKYASNAFLATKLSFVNAVAGLCEAVGADVRDVILGLGYDRRIGFEYLRPGPGWGGSCLPKDTLALVHIAEQAGYDFSFLKGAIATNDEQFNRVVDKVRRVLAPQSSGRGGTAPEFAGAVIAVWGLTFKAGTDDLRNSPAMEIALRLAEGGAEVRAYDPTVVVPEGDGSVTVPGFAPPKWPGTIRVRCSPIPTPTSRPARRGGRAGGPDRMGRVPLARLHPGPRRPVRPGVRRCPQSARSRPGPSTGLLLRGDRSPMSQRTVVLGGSGFLGSHLCDQLLSRGDEVVCVDDFSTGRRANVAHLGDHDRFTLVEADISTGIPVEGDLSGVFNLASPASPPDYLALPLETLAVGSEGTRNGLELARRHGVRFLQASTSEVYGDPEVHPQPETYWGHVNPIGPRSVYDEAKRFSEALTMAYHRALGTDVAIVRIFNTYGPRLRPDDGRVVSNFLLQAMRGDPLTVYGDGSQTRSLCYVEDEVRGLLALFDSDLTGPVNIGNPDEYTVLQLARTVIALFGSSSTVEHRPLPTDDPTRRRPDISVARAELGWEPTTSLEDGLARTAAYLAEDAGIVDASPSG